MAIALSQDNVAAGARDNSSASTLTVTFTKTTTAGHILLLSCHSASSQTLSSISDSRGNTWQVDKTNATGSFAPTANIASCLVSTGHSISDTLTLTFSGAALYSAGIVSEWSGLASSSWVDVTAAGQSASAAVATSVTSTRTQASELIYACASTNSFNLTGGTNYTLLTIKSSGAGARNVFPEYQIVSATGTDAATWTNGPVAFEAALVTYKAASSVTQANPPGFRFGFR